LHISAVQKVDTLINLFYSALPQVNRQEVGYFIRDLGPLLYTFTFSFKGVVKFILHNVEWNLVLLQLLHKMFVKLRWPAVPNDQHHAIEPADALIANIQFHLVLACAIARQIPK
jgi:hypothetical protein